MRILYELNPWWEYKNWENIDEDIVKWNNQKIHWIPNWIKNISLNPFSLNFIVGPRQVGKTTGIKILIKDILKEYESFAVFYANLEIFTSLEEFRNALFWYSDIKKENKIKNSFIFLDEASKLKGWDRILKAFIDVGKFKKDVITVSGSSSINVTKDAEAFTGRIGKGKKIKVLPFSFPEFLRIHGIDTNKYFTFESKINRLFSEYLQKGGFPKSINNLLFFSEFISGIEREIEEQKKNSRIAKTIITALIESMPSPTSYHKIAGRVATSHKVVMEYIEMLEDLFLIKTAFLKENKRINYRREKKFFFRDPFIKRALTGWCNISIEESIVLEHVVQEHLLRKFGEIYYFRDGYEIDCIAKQMKVEVKSKPSNKKYPKDVIVLDKYSIPKFLIELENI